MHDSAAISRAAAAAAASLREAHCSLFARLLEAEETRRAHALQSALSREGGWREYAEALREAWGAAAARVEGAGGSLAAGSLEPVGRHVGALATALRTAEELARRRGEAEAEAEGRESCRETGGAASRGALQSRRGRALLEAGVSEEMLLHLSDDELEALWEAMQLSSRGAPAAPQGEAPRAAAGGAAKMRGSSQMQGASRRPSLLPQHTAVALHASHPSPLTPHAHHPPHPHPHSPPLPLVSLILPTLTRHHYPSSASSFPPSPATTTPPDLADHGFTPEMLQQLDFSEVETLWEGLHDDKGHGDASATIEADPIAHRELSAVPGPSARAIEEMEALVARLRTAGSRPRRSAPPPAAAHSHPPPPRELRLRPAASSYPPPQHGEGGTEVAYSTAARSNLLAPTIVFANSEIEPAHEGGFHGIQLHERAAIETAEQAVRAVMRAQSRGFGQLPPEERSALPPADAPRGGGAFPIAAHGKAPPPCADDRPPTARQSFAMWAERDRQQESLGMRGECRGKGWGGGAAGAAGTKGSRTQSDEWRDARREKERGAREAQVQQAQARMEAEREYEAAQLREYEENARKNAMNDAHRRAPAVKARPSNDSCARAGEARRQAELEVQQAAEAKLRPPPPPPAAAPPPKDAAAGSSFFSSLASWFGS
ncbi:hypothetical protein AB1Y20_014348 [Prymnesium parvum]|uniref:Uncharacterized protein n=1 Tax=Prymnesium parvum TaxID=97485 RepID=A0AB34IHD4_PRYPA